MYNNCVDQTIKILNNKMNKSGCVAFERSWIQSYALHEMAHWMQPLKKLIDFNFHSELFKFYSTVELNWRSDHLNVCLLLLTDEM